jgi:uncharacterized membrane protein YcaP (DUF421 family)
MFLFGGLAAQAIATDDHSVTNAVIGISTIALNHLSVSALKQRFSAFRKVVDDAPVIVVRNGEVDARLLHGLRMLEEDLLAAVRQKKIERLEDGRLAVVERDGNISIFKRNA